MDFWKRPFLVYGVSQYKAGPVFVEKNGEDTRDTFKTMRLLMNGPLAI